MILVLYVGGVVVSLDVNRTFGNVVGGGVSVYAGRTGRNDSPCRSIPFAVLVSKATRVVCILGGAFPIGTKTWPGFLPSV